MTKYNMIYYRTASTPNTNILYATPDLMLANAPNQCTVFERPVASLDNVSLTYSNNINYFQSITLDGSRIRNVQDNGIGDLSISLTGVFTKSDGGGALYNLFTSARTLQTDQGYVFGKFGFYSPNAPFFNVDPFATSGTGEGYSFKKFDVSRVTKVPNLYIFNIMLGYGGTGY